MVVDELGSEGAEIGSLGGGNGLVGLRGAAGAAVHRCRWRRSAESDGKKIFDFYRSKWAHPKSVIESYRTIYVSCDRIVLI